jgi:hypothetical protein
MDNKMKQSIRYFGIIVLFTIIQAQVSTNETPYGIIHNLNRSAIPVAIMPVVNVDSLIIEDAIESMDTPMRFAYAHPTQFNLTNSGLWKDLGNDERLWRMKISSPGAYSISLVYSHYQLPVGAKLSIYNENGTHIIGAFTDYNNTPNGEFSTQPVQGENIIVELFLPPGASGELLEIAHVVHDYRNIFGYGDSESCNINVNCTEWADWSDQKRSVAMILLGNNTRWCSGALINNTENEDIQYFLTAEHCVDYFGYEPGDQVNWITMFNYESPSCNNEDGPTNQTVQGMIIRAMNSSSDFALLEINNETIPLDYDVFYSGWSREDILASNVVGIHHPANDIKKIAFDSDPISLNYAWDYLPNSHWYVENWDIGTTEGGSSGSPLYNSNYRIIGQDHSGNGYAPCDVLKGTHYGSFAYSWDHGNSSTNRLKDWIDPNNTDLQYIDGRENLDIAQVYLTNRLVGEEQSNLHGTLSLDNQNTSEYEYYREPSGSLVEIVISDPYFIKTYLDVDGDYIHNQWASSSKYFLENSISSISDQNIDAFYKLQNTVNISVHHPIALQLHDPWYLENPDAEPAEWVQPDAFRPLSEQDYGNGNVKVFLNQNLDFNPMFPIYRIKAPGQYATLDGIYVFSHWEGHSDIDYGNGSGELSTNHETPVVFLAEGTSVNAIYENALITGATVSVPSNDVLLLPAGSDYLISNSDFGIHLGDNASLVSLGTEENRVRFKMPEHPENPLTDGWQGINVGTGNIDLSYTIIQDARLAVMVSSVEDWRVYRLNHTEISNCYYLFSGGTESNVARSFQLSNNTFVGGGINIRGDVEYISLHNNIFENCNITFLLSLNRQFPNPITYNLFHDCDFNEIDLSGLHTSNIEADPLFIDATNGDYHLQTNSPCIDAGSYNSDDDPDGTRADMGAYYYEIPNTNLELVIEGEVGAHPRITWNTDNLPEGIELDKYEVYSYVDVDNGLNINPIFVAETDSIFFVDVRFTIAYVEQTDTGRRVKLKKLGTIPEQSYKVKRYWTVKVRDMAGHKSPFAQADYAWVEIGGPIHKTATDLIPKEYALLDAYPNPFNPITNIKIDIPENSHIKLTVFDLSGRVVTNLVNKNITAGTHHTIWNGKDNKGRQVSSGVYLYTLMATSNETGKMFTQSNKMVLLK